MASPAAELPPPALLEPTTLHCCYDWLPTSNALQPGYPLGWILMATCDALGRLLQPHVIPLIANEPPAAPAHALPAAATATAGGQRGCQAAQCYSIKTIMQARQHFVDGSQLHGTGAMSNLVCGTSVHLSAFGYAALGESKLLVWL